MCHETNPIFPNIDSFFHFNNSYFYEYNYNNYSSKKIYKTVNKSVNRKHKKAQEFSFESRISKPLYEVVSSLFLSNININWNLKSPSCL
jgi:hypothetical protein